MATTKIGRRMTVPLTWLGHASFRLDSPGGKRIYVDPWLGNPKCPDPEDANHSSSGGDGRYLGEPAGIVLELEDGFTLYFAGGTNVFASMQLIGRI